jgi:hypothetical protein
MTPFKFFYGQKALLVASYLLNTSKVHEVDYILHSREAILHIVKDNLVLAQNRINLQVDQHHLEHSFAKGDQFFLHLKPYKKTCLKDIIHQKLAPKFYGSYTII